MTDRLFIPTTTHAVLTAARKRKQGGRFHELPEKNIAVKSRNRRTKHRATSSPEDASGLPPSPPTTRHALWLLIPAYLPWLILLGWFTAVTWFLCDDAFIGFRYVRNLVEGHGLVFNPGEYVEGYTNFLWLLELAALWALTGIPPEHVAPFLSVACTIGTLAVALWWVHRTPSLPHRGLVGWMALGLLCSSATFAVWTSAGGLATRQFTFFVLAGLVALSVHGARRRGLLAASLCFAAAELTRPEGLMLGGCFLGGFALCRMVRAGRPWRPWRDWRALAVMGAPFALVVAGHYLWRYGYYGEWLPNTYYAKYVSPWYDSGFRYLAQAGIETGAYLLLPLALVAAIARWRRHQDGTHLVILLGILVHGAYVARIGGDHFEYRPLDFYWPLLAVGAAVGLVSLGTRLAAWVGKNRNAGAPVAWTLALFAPVLIYAGAIQGALVYEGSKKSEYLSHMYIELNEENAGRWLVAPGLSKLAALSNALRRKSTQRMAPTPWMEHRAFAPYRQQQWKPYENMPRGTLPDDAVAMVGSLGVKSYYLPDLEIIDYFGLTDATVARNPQPKPPDRSGRRIAHERQPPPGYLKQRGVNFDVKPAARSAAEALRRAHYALEVAPNLWMPFDAADHAWVAERFAGRNLKSRESP